MNDLHEARKQTKALLAFAKAVVAQDEALDNLADIGKQTVAAEQARDQIIQSNINEGISLNRVRALKDAAVADVAAASTAVAEKIKEGERIVSAAKAAAADIATAAEQVGKSKLEQAERDADGIISKAKERERQLDLAIADAQDTLAELNSKIVGADQRLTDTNAEIERLRGLFAPK